MNSDNLIYNLMRLEPFYKENLLIQVKDDLNYTNPFKKIYLIESYLDYFRFLSESIKHHEKNSVALCGRINHDFAEIIYINIGLNLMNYRLLIDSDTVRHIYKKHYTYECEMKINPKLFLNFGGLTEKALHISYLPDLERIEITARFFNELYKIIYAIDFKHANIYLVTFYRIDDDFMTHEQVC